MKTNRDEILQNCFSVFVSANYEKATITELSQACGLSRMGIHHYFPNKQAVFMAVADRYVFDTHTPANKFAGRAASLEEFIEQYVCGVEATMLRLAGPYGCVPRERGGVAANFHYFHFILQVRLYYPGAETKFRKMLAETRNLWRRAVERAVAAGEVRPDIDIRLTASMFLEIHYGLSFEMAFFRGLDIRELHRNFRALYELIRA